MIMHADEKDRAAKALGYPGYIEAIRGLYVDQKWSTRKVASRLGVSRVAVSLRLKSMGIERRPSGGANNPWGCRGKR